MRQRGDDGQKTYHAMDDVDVRQSDATVKPPRTSGQQHRRQHPRIGDDAHLHGWDIPEMDDGKTEGQREHHRRREDE